MERRLRATLPNGKFENVPESRSRGMGRIRSKGNRTTENRLRFALVRAGVNGWTMHEKITGTPNFFFAVPGMAVFVDGCFWHGCTRCGHVPSTNRPFWRTKIRRNQQRDRVTDELLSETGITVIRFWEHELRDSTDNCVARVLKQVVTRPH